MEGKTPVIGLDVWNMPTPEVPEPPTRVHRSVVGSLNWEGREEYRLPNRLLGIRLRASDVVGRATWLLCGRPA